MSDESIKNSFTPDNSFNLKWIDGYPLPKLKVTGNCLRQGEIVIGNCLLGAVKLRKNSDPE